jgi:F0F1-type ATP synthase assembly protein I
MNGSMLSSAVSLISGSLSFLLDVSLLVVALTIVRKRRADAGLLIAASAGVQLFTTITIRVAYAVMASTASSSYRELAAIIQLGGAFANAIAMVLLILGVVKLAQDEPSNGRSPY